MIAKGLIYILFIILSGSFMLLSLIMTLVKYSGNTNGAWKWLIGFFAGILFLSTSVFLFTKGVISKTKQFTENIAQMGFEQIEVLDSLHRIKQLKEDSLLQSERVSALIQMESGVFKGKAPSQFYCYLGFRDYYRMPLRYPYSLHCIDSLGDAELYDEENVLQFDVNNNGELFCDVDHIKTFCFDKNYLIGTRTKINSGKPISIFFIYDFDRKITKEFISEKELMNYAKTKGFEREFEFTSCKDYYNSF